jgi:hypothetical protein
MSEQSEKSFDAWPAATQMFGDGGIGERAATGLKELFVVLESDVAPGLLGQQRSLSGQSRHIAVV